MSFDLVDTQMLIEPSMNDFQPPVVDGDGPGGGPSSLEQDILNTRVPWDPTVWSDDVSILTQLGYLYIDRDQNGWFDYVEFAQDDGTLWVWKDEHGWQPKQNGDGK